MHSPARKAWKARYRQMRIIRRESGKAWQDAMIYGTGAVRVGEDIADYIRHVPAIEIFNEAAPISKKAWDALKVFSSEKAK